MPDVFTPFALGPATLPNRVIKAATYEGLSRRGLVTDELIEFHRKVAGGGVGMTTVAYCAVSKDGRTDKNQITWRDEALPGLQALTAAVHAEGALVSAQVGHGGPVAEARSNRAPALSPSRRLNTTAFNVSKAATVQELDRVVADHRRAGELAVAAGFDAVEVHLGHNYLASAFLSPRLNRRRDEYGGSLANRARLARRLVQAVREGSGGRLAVLAKLNLEDGVRGGLQVDESVQVAQWLEQDGNVDALVLTAGSSLLNPMYLFRGDAPREDFAALMPPLVKLGIKVVGRRFMREYPFEELYLLEQARRVRQGVKLPLVLLGGVSSGAALDTAMAEGFELVEMGRALLREPNLLQRIRADRGATSACIHCNRCMPTNYTGTRCVVIEPTSPRRSGWGRGETIVGTAVSPS
jgi:2,4-dienoyl-CoA reductase-like NADH-dependent reductase (Old Yellow Enzyme family)